MVIMLSDRACMISGAKSNSKGEESRVILSLYIFVSLHVESLRTGRDCCPHKFLFFSRHCVPCHSDLVLGLLCDLILIYLFLFFDVVDYVCINSEAFLF